MIHSREEYEKAVEASADPLRRRDLRGVCAGSTNRRCCRSSKGCRSSRVARAELAAVCRSSTSALRRREIFPSKGECRKMVQGGGVALNKEKVADAMRPVTEADLIAGKYLLVQRGKKNYYLVTVE